MLLTTDLEMIVHPNEMGAGWASTGILAARALCCVLLSARWYIFGRPDLWTWAGWIPRGPGNASFSGHYNQTNKRAALQ